MKKIVLIITALYLLCLPVFADQIEVGDFIEIGTFEDQAILWEVIHVEDDLLLWSAYGLFDYSLDAEQPFVPQSLNVNTWPDMTLRRWLNSNEEIVTYKGTPPDAEHCDSPYDNVPGFLTSFDEEELELINTSTYKVLLNKDDDHKKEGGSEYYNFIDATVYPNQAMKNYDKAYFTLLEDKVFLLSLEEVYNYVIANDIDVKRYMRDGSEMTFNRLRTVGRYKESPLTLSSAGMISDTSGFLLAKYSYPSLPAMYVNLDSIKLTGHGTKKSPYKINTSQVAETIANGSSVWSKDAILRASENNLLTDKTSHRFTEAITREEFAELMVKFYEYMSDKSIELVNKRPFIDTDNQEVAKAFQVGIISGVGQSKFAPDQLVTREQICTMIYKTLKLTTSNISDTRSSLKFNDASFVSNYALSSIEFMTYNKMISGIGNNQFNPKGPATIEAAIVIMDNVLDKYDKVPASNEIKGQVISLGDKGSIIYNISNNLNRYAEEHNLTPCDYSEEYTEEKSAKVKEFQKNMNLKETGLVDEETYKYLTNRNLWLSDNEIVEIPDTEFERYIRSLLNKETGDLYQSDLRSIESIYINYSVGQKYNIKSIEGIQECTNIKNLRARDLDVKDIDLIGELKKLERLELYKSSLTDIEFLSGLENLRSVDLRNHTVSDLSPLESSKNIFYLRLDNNTISDLTPLSSLENLTSFHADNNQIKSLEPLKDLDKLQAVSINDNQVSSLEPLRNKPLFYLSIENNKVADISILETTPEMYTLNLSNNPIKDFSPIEGLRELGNVDLDYLNLTNLKFLSKSTNIKTLSATHNQINSLAGLEDLYQLETAYLNDNGSMPSIEVMANWKNLGRLHLYHTITKDFSPLKQLTNLYAIDFSIHTFDDLVKHKDVFEYLYTLQNGLLLNGSFSDSQEDRVTIDYILSKQLEEDAKKIKAITNKIFYKENMTDYEKVVAVQQYVIENITYDYGLYYSGISDNPHGATIDVRGVLFEEITVCSGYANVVHFLLNAGNVESYYIHGTVEGEGHAWNIVKVDGKYYHLDATWDDTNNETNPDNWRYFLISDDLMAERGRRTWDRDKYKTCPTSYK